MTDYPNSRSPLARTAGMDPDRLAAFADGELSPEEAAEVVIHLADHPQDQALVDEIMAANEALARAFAGPMQQDVPAGLRSLILQEAPPETATVLPFRARSFRRSGLITGGFGLAAAAAVLMAVLLPGGAAPGAFTPGQVAADSVLAQVLASTPTGEEARLDGGQVVTVLATLPVTGGHCREVEAINRAAALLEIALACHDRSGWRVEVALVEALPAAVADAGFIPAGGAETLGLTPWLDRLGAGIVLTPAEEAALIADGWAN